MSIYRRALGADFDRLHPEIRRRFDLDSTIDVAHLGSGVMHRITRGPKLISPFLWLGTTRNLLFPESGTDVPFTVANYAYRDAFGRETITWHRRFDLGHRSRTFDATMIYSAERGTIVDYLGSHQHLATDLVCHVDSEGGINFTSGEQRFYERGLRFRFPRALTGHARVREWFDDIAGCFRIEVDVTNPIVGHVFGYQGSFTIEQVPLDHPGEVPAHIRPRRETHRE
ncbi:MAG: DUF4166 domain-containing protein [Acidimicrobiales bacterium]